MRSTFLKPGSRQPDICAEAVEFLSSLMTGLITLRDSGEPLERLNQTAQRALSPFKLKKASYNRWGSFGLLLVIHVLIAGCASKPPVELKPARRFDFKRDTFAYPSE